MTATTCRIVFALAVLLAGAGCAAPTTPRGSRFDATCEPLSTALEAAAANEPGTYRSFRVQAARAAGRLASASPTDSDVMVLAEFARALTHVPMGQVQRAEARALRVQFGRVREICTIAEKVPGD